MEREADDYSFNTILANYSGKQLNTSILCLRVVRKNVFP